MKALNFIEKERHHQKRVSLVGNVSLLSDFIFLQILCLSLSK